MGPKIEPLFKRALVLIVLIILFSAYTAANSASAPRISGVYADPVKVRPGDTMLVMATVGKILLAILILIIVAGAPYVYHYLKKGQEKSRFRRTGESEKHVIDAQREHIRRVTHVLKEVIKEPEELPLWEEVPAVKELLEDGILIT